MVEETTFASGALRLEARLEQPAGATRAAVICHPHPLHGGSMDNNVVDALAAACRDAGCATLRFNFRGVGGSDGGYGDFRGECDDARAAIAFLRERTGDLPVVLAGYSFGAMVALQVAAEHPAVTRVVAVAPPLAMGEVAVPARVPTLVLAGDRDSYCPPAAVATYAARLAPGSASRVLAGADHFFGGHEPAITASVRDLLAEDPR
jgi:alpha/beta superfamily hydrolase